MDFLSDYPAQIERSEGEILTNDKLTLVLKKKTAQSRGNKIVMRSSTLMNVMMTVL